MCSRAEGPRVSFRCARTAGRFAFATVALLLCLLPARAVERLSLQVAEVANPAFALHELQVVFDADRGAAVLSVARARLGTQWLRELHLRCGRAALSLDGPTCHGAELRVGGQALPASFDLELNFRTGRTRLLAALGQDGRIDVLLDDDGNVRARLFELSPAALQPLLERLIPEVARTAQDLSLVGRASGEFEWSSPGNAASRITARLRLADAGFSSADGLQAAEGVGLDLALDARQAGEAWAWAGSLAWERGAAYLHPLYLEAGVTVAARGRIDAERIRIEQADVELEGVPRLRASAEVDLDALDRASLVLDVERADLALIGPRWIAPLMMPASADRLRLSGFLSAALRLQQGRLQTVDVVVDEVAIGLSAAVEGAGVALGPVAGSVAWAQDASTRAQLEVRGGRWEKLSLGAFRVDAELSGDSVRFARMTVPVLDGALVLDDLSLMRDAAGWQGSGSVVIEPMSMPDLTAALELPLMSGVLSASLPGLRVRPGEIALDGALVISVFEGYLQATGLRLREPFGVASHLSADIEARHIDLAQLTETFSFGSMSGFVDADVRGLELVRWRPVGFDARLTSSSGDYPRRISQRAVENISALGGAGAMAAIQRSLLRLFSTFGYREIGLHCRLEGGVCLMDGIAGDARADGGFVIVRGGGVPALDVIGYNRRVDWEQLIGRLQRVIADNVSPEPR